MEIILNELSLNNIREDKDFLEISRIISVVNNEFLKKSNLYTEEIGITNKETGRKYKLSDYIKKTRTEEIKKFKSELLSLTTNDPFWDMDSKQLLEYDYLCNWTKESSNYGIAEAVERSNVVFSIKRNEAIKVQKKKKDNTISKEITIKNITTYQELILEMYNNGEIDCDNFLKKSEFKLYKITEEFIKNFIKNDLAIKQQIIANFIKNDNCNNIEEFDKFNSPLKAIYAGTAVERLSRKSPVHKYRIDSKVRCWGIKVEKRFSPIYLELNKEIN
ncbi:MAG: hypothetical protein ACRCXY_10955 [Fusobacteriaceae bacterium]